MIPGELLPQDGDLELNAGRPTVTVTVANTGDRPVQIGSHYHFYEVNDALRFDREAARGFRLNIAACGVYALFSTVSRETCRIELSGSRGVVAPLAERLCRCQQDTAQPGRSSD